MPRSLKGKVGNKRFHLKFYKKMYLTNYAFAATFH